MFSSDQTQPEFRALQGGQSSLCPREAAIRALMTAALSLLTWPWLVGCASVPSSSAPESPMTNMPPASWSAEVVAAAPAAPADLAILERPVPPSGDALRPAERRWWQRSSRPSLPPPERERIAAPAEKEAAVTAAAAIEPDGVEAARSGAERRPGWFFGIFARRPSPPDEAVEGTVSEVGNETNCPAIADTPEPAALMAADDGDARSQANAALQGIGGSDLAALREFRISPQDTVFVEVFGEADISRSYKVTAQGFINHPLLQRVELAGLTLEEAEMRLRALLREGFLVDPRVSVRVEESTARRVFVFGEVKDPGTYMVPHDQPMSLLRLFSLAGGFTDLAAINRVRVVRRVDGAEETIKVNVADLLKGRGNMTDIELAPGDIVTVPETIF